MKKQELLQGKNLEPYWGVLPPDPAIHTFHKPDNFISQIRALYQTAPIASALPAQSSFHPGLPGQGSHKHHSGHLSKDIPL